jgi:hypothetical protein
MLGRQVLRNNRQNKCRQLAKLSASEGSFNSPSHAEKAEQRMETKVKHVL